MEKKRLNLHSQHFQLLLYFYHVIDGVNGFVALSGKLSRLYLSFDQE